MHGMRTTAISDPSVCQSDMLVACAETAERIDVLFRVETPGDPTQELLYQTEVPIPHAEGWQSMQPLRNYFDRLLLLMMITANIAVIVSDIISIGRVAHVAS